MPAAVSTATAFSFQPTPFEIARINFEKASAYLQLSSQLHVALSTPQYEVRVEIPICDIADGVPSKQFFGSHRPQSEGLHSLVGYRVQHNGIRGVCLGGMEFCEDFDRDRAKAMAEIATWKAALLDLPIGGSHGGVACDPAKLSQWQLDRLGRAFVARTHNLLGPLQDVVALSPEIPLDLRQAMLAELSHAHRSLAVAANGEGENGEISLQAFAIGCALATLVQKVAQETSLGTSLRVAVAGFNEQAAAVATSLHKAGANLVALTGRDSSGATTISVDGALGVDCDVLIVTDRRVLIHPGNAKKIKAHLLFEAADLVLSPAVDILLQNAGVTVIPDLIANAGSAISAYLEWSMGLQGVAGPHPKLTEGIERRLLRAYRTAREYAANNAVSLRTAAYAIGMNRVACLEKLKAA